MRTRRVILAFLIYTLLQLAAYGQIPRTLSYEGLLTDALGNPKPDSVYSIAFRLYPASSGGIPVWVEVKSLQVKRGLFQTMLGDQASFGALAFDQPYWLSIQVAPDVEQSPRIPLTAVGYSISSVKSDTSRVAGTIPDNSVTSAKIADGGIQFSDIGQNGATDGQVMKWYGTGWVPRNDSVPPPGPWQVNGSSTYHDPGNVGIGTSTPNPSGIGGWAPVLTLGPSGTDNASILELQSNTGLDQGVGAVVFRNTAIGTPDNAVALIESDRDGVNHSGNLRFLTRSGGYVLGLPISFLAERMRITSAGAVGIGTPNPQKFLSLWGGMNIDQSNYGDGSLGNGLTFGSLSGEGITSKRTAGGNQFGLDFFTASTERLTISYNGNVGIGTSSPNPSGEGSWAPVVTIGPSGTDKASVLELQGNTNANTGIGAVVFRNTAIGAVQNSVGQIHVIRDNADDAGKMYFLTRPASGSMAERMVIGSNGYVGIGTSYPQQLLSVGGGMNIDQFNYSDGSIANGLTFGSSSGEGIASNRVGGVNQFGLDFFTGSADRMTILNTGNVGIGITSPAFPVDIRTSSYSVHTLHVESNNSAGLIGIYGAATGSAGAIGVFGYAPNGYGIVGKTDVSSLVYAGVLGDAPGVGGTGVYSHGNFIATGVKAFQIDHPLDPANKLLNHYCTEGPEPLNVYGGSVVANTAGEAWITLPDYFESINKDYRYQLTPVGAAMPDLHVATEIDGHRFMIAGAKAGMKVCWQVTGTRNDLYVAKTGIHTEALKDNATRGKYLHPELYGQPASMGVFWNDKEKPSSNGVH